MTLEYFKGSTDYSDYQKDLVDRMITLKSKGVKFLFRDVNHGVPDYLSWRAVWLHDSFAWEELEKTIKSLEKKTENSPASILLSLGIIDKP